MADTPTRGRKNHADQMSAVDTPSDIDIVSGAVLSSPTKRPAPYVVLFSFFWGTVDLTACL